MKDIDDYVIIYNVNPLYFIIDKVDGYIEENNWNKYTVIASTEKNKELLTKYTELSITIKNLIEKINGKPVDYDEKNIRNKFDSDDLPVNKKSKLHNLAIIFRSVFQEGNKYYLHKFF